MQLCYGTMAPLIQLYEHFYGQAMAWLASDDLASSPNTQLHDFEISVLLYKIIAALVIYAWGGGTPVNDEEVAANQHLEQQQRSFCTTGLSHYRNMRSLRRSKAVTGQLSTAPYLQSLNKHVRAYTKLYTHLLRNNHLAFHSIGMTHDLCGLLWTQITEASHNTEALASDDDPAAPDLEKLIVAELLLLRDCFVRWPMAMANWEDPEFAAQIADLIMSRLLPLRAADLEKWQEEPEDWFKEQEELQWQYDLRVRHLLRPYYAADDLRAPARCPGFPCRHCQEVHR